jgi:hypothetical protein
MTMKHGKSSRKRKEESLKGSGIRFEIQTGKTRRTRKENESEAGEENRL